MFRRRARIMPATVVGDKLYVFGGYGGHGKAYDDMYVLDFGTALEKPETVTEKVAPRWSKPTLKGKGPTPRFDHTMTWFSRSTGHPRRARQHDDALGRASSRSRDDVLAG